MTCSLIPQFSSEDVAVVRVKNVRREGDSFVFVSAYIALDGLHGNKRISAI